MPHRRLGCRFWSKRLAAARRSRTRTAGEGRRSRFDCQSRAANAESPPPRESGTAQRAGGSPGTPRSAGFFNNPLRADPVTSRPEKSRERALAFTADVNARAREPAEPETHSWDEGNCSVWVQPCGNPGTYHGSISRRRQPHADRGDRDPCRPSEQPTPRGATGQEDFGVRKALPPFHKTGSVTFRRPFRSREKRRQPRRAALFTPREGELISRSACCRTSGTRRSWRSARRRRPGSG